MRFQRLDLIKYGKFSDRSIEFPTDKRDFHLIIGPNEAGKSTLRSAIVDLLFGIPSRSMLSFLHPLNELRLGAQISNAAETLEFQRAKAQKQTLRSALDVVLPDNALNPFLSTGDRNFFEKMFGLDHAKLVDGGNSILKAEDDVGQILFQSAAGVASLGNVRDALLAEADKLWAPRKANDRAYYAATDQLDKATAALKEATVRTKVWSEANSKVEELQEKIAETKAQHQTLQQQRNLLERVRRLAPDIGKIQANENALAELGVVIELPEDAKIIRDTAEHELDIAQRDLNKYLDDEANLTASLEKIQLDEDVLTRADDIANSEECRIKFSPYPQEIKRLETEINSLWQQAIKTANQLGWPSESTTELAVRIPSLLVRKELAQLARVTENLQQNLKTAEQSEKAKQDELATLEQQLADCQAAEIPSALRIALANAKAPEIADSAFQKQKIAVTKAKSVLDTTMQGLGQWRLPPDELAALLLPSPQKITRLLQERQNLAVEQKAVAKGLQEQKSTIARLDLVINQFKALHQPTTHDDVTQARADRDSFWSAIKLGTQPLQQAGNAFEEKLAHADTLADKRLNDVEQATQLQTLQHQLEREQQTLAKLTEQHTHLELGLNLFDQQWQQEMATLGLPAMPLEDIGNWLAMRDKVLVAAAAYHDAQVDWQAMISNAGKATAELINAFGKLALDVADTDNRAILCMQAENFIKASDDAKVRHETLSVQLAKAHTQLASLQQATETANMELDQWRGKWVQALSQAKLPDNYETGTAEAALELITTIETSLNEIQGRQENINAMNTDLDRFATEALRLSQLIDPELIEHPATDISRALAKRLAVAKETAKEAAQIKAALQKAKNQLAAAKEAIQTATAKLEPLMRRAGVDNQNLLAEAIARSDTYRRITGELAAANANLIKGSDGLHRTQIEAELAQVDLSTVATELKLVDENLSEIVQQQNSLSVEHANAQRVLSDIGGSDAAAQAEAQRQEALAKMADVAERYIKVFTAGRLLRWSIDRYREKKQGPLLARAGAIFAKLTLGSFQRLSVDVYKNPPTLEGLCSDGKLVGIEGLSDGTRDQLYLALRLAALEMHLEQATPLPFIADDLFINYDDARAKAGLEALAALSERTQVIFLSHHDHLVPTVKTVFGDQVNVVYL